MDEVHEHEEESVPDPDVLHCDQCDIEIPLGEARTFQRKIVCTAHALTRAAAVVEPWLDPYWSPPPGSIRQYEEARALLEVVLAVADARVRAEGNKRMVFAARRMPRREAHHA